MDVLIVVRSNEVLLTNILRGRIRTVLPFMDVGIRERMEKFWGRKSRTKIRAGRENNYSEDLVR